MDIHKTSGEVEPFSEEKLRLSLERAGAGSALIESVLKKTRQQLKRQEQPSTQPLFNYIREELASQDPMAQMRYGLKRSLMRIGPSGHPFEFFFAKVLEEYGYTTEVGQIIDGHCVPHEVDIVATRASDGSPSPVTGSKLDERLMIESKFHTRSGLRSTLKDALYIHARYLDVRSEEKSDVCFPLEPTEREQLLTSTTHKAHDRSYDHSQDDEIHAPRGFTHGVLVTNTKVTLDGRMYAACAGLHVIGWRYPEGVGVETLIEQKRMYPVSVFTDLTKDHLATLFEHKIYSVKDLEELEAGQLAQWLKLPEQEMQTMLELAHQLRTV